MFLAPPETPDVVYEFFSPFAHVEGRYELCRIRSPTHGVFDTLILLAESPPVVYTNSDAGLRFLNERFPEVQAIQVPSRRLTLRESDDGRRVEGTLKADKGPLKAAKLTISAQSTATPRNVPYGGKGEGIWGSKRYTCWGVDLVLDAAASGKLVWRDRPALTLKNEPALLTLGSFGRIAPMPTLQAATRPSARGKSATSI